MMSKTITWMLAFLIVMSISAVSVMAGYNCYQGVANISSNCSSGIGGSYFVTADGTWTDPLLGWDGDFSTKATRSASSPTVLINYTIPTGATSANITYRIGTDDQATEVIPGDCMSYALNTTNKLQFRVRLTSDTGNKANISCFHTATDVITIQATDSNTYFYEMGVTWLNSSVIRLVTRSERTGQMVTDSGTVEVWGANSSSVYTLYSGIGYWVPWADEVFNIRNYVAAYSTRNYYLSGNDSDYMIDLFMLNTSSSLLVQFTVTDMSSAPYAGVIVEAYRQVQGYSTYQAVAMGQTDNNGITVMYLEPYSVPYMFKVKSGNLYIFNSTLPAVISAASTYIKIGTFNDTSASYYDAQSIFNTIYYSNVSKGFYFWYNDTADLGITKGRIEVILHTSLTDTVLCNNSAAADNAIIFCNMSDYQNRTGTFTGQSFVTINGIEYYLDSASKILNVKLERAWGLSGPLYAFILIMVLFCAGLWNPVASVILGCLGVILAVVLGLLPLSFTWVVGLIVLAYIGVRRMMA